MTVAKKYQIDFIELCSAWITATEENVVSPPAKPGMRARRSVSDVMSRYATTPATTTPMMLEMKIAEG